MLVYINIYTINQLKVYVICELYKWDYQMAVSDIFTRRHLKKINKHIYLMPWSSLLFDTTFVEYRNKTPPTSQ